MPMTCFLNIFLTMALQSEVELCNTTVAAAIARSYSYSSTWSLIEWSWKCVREEHCT